MDPKQDSLNGLYTPADDSTKAVGKDGLIGMEIGRDASAAVLMDEERLYEGRPRWKLFLSCALILSMELCERMAYYGVNFTLVVYLTSQLSFGVEEASVDTNNWSGTCYLFPLLGAWLADSYLGRYWVILIFSLIYTIGLSGLAMSASLPSLHPAEPPILMTQGQLCFFWFSMYLVAIGTGGIKPCVSTFGADQFDMKNPRDAKLLSSFFVYFYCSVNVGALISAIVLIDIQEQQGNALVYIICAGGFVIAISCYCLGTRLYVFKPPSGSALSRAAQVMWRALVNRNLPLPANSGDLHEIDGPPELSTIYGQPKIPHTDAMIMFDKAALVTDDGVRVPLTVTQVEEFKAVVRFFPILLVSILWWMTYSMMSTLFILGGQNMTTLVGTLNIPAATMNSADILAVIACAGLYEYVVSPFAVKIGRPINLMWRIGFGYILAMMSMIAAALIEVRRNNLIAANPTVLGQPDAQAPISIMWQIPQYALIGAAEVCTVVGMMELFYRECPQSVRSMASALLLLCSGLSSYFTSALQEIVQEVTTKGGKAGWIAENLNEARLDSFYWVLAVINLVGFLLYIWIAIVFVKQGHANDAHRAMIKSGQPQGEGMPELKELKQYKDMEATAAEAHTDATAVNDDSAANGIAARAR